MRLYRGENINAVKMKTHKLELDKDDRKFSCGPTRHDVGTFGQARANKCLPTMPLSHSTVVCTLPSMWREAGLKSPAACTRKKHH